MVQEQVQENKDVVKSTSDKKVDIAIETSNESANDFIVKYRDVPVSKGVTSVIKKNKRKRNDQVTSSKNKVQMAQCPSTSGRFTRSMAKQLVPQQHKEIKPLLIEDSSIEERMESPFNECPNVIMELEPNLLASGGWSPEENSCHVSIKEPIAPSSPKNEELVLKDSAERGVKYSKL